VYFHLFTALYLSDEDESKYFFPLYDSIASKVVNKSQEFYYQTYASLPSLDVVSLEPIRDYFSDVSLPQFHMPAWNFNLGWLFTPLISFGVAFRELIFGSPMPRDQLKMTLDEDRFQILLQHIDAYIDNTIGSKLFNEQQSDKGAFKEVNDRFHFLIANHIKDALIKYEYTLTSKDIDAIVAKVQKDLKVDLNERDKIILSRISLSNDEAVKKIATLTSAQQDVKLDNQKIDLDAIIAMILNSDKLFTIVDGRLKPIIDRLDLHDAEIAGIKLHLDTLKKEILQKFTDNSNDIKNTDLKIQNYADELYKLKFDNDATLQKFMHEINEKFSTFGGSQFSSIDASVRKNILTILGFSNEGDVASMSEGDIKEWISSTFVAKNYLEERLNNLELNSNKIFQLQLDKNAGILMEEVNKEIEKQIALALAAKASKESSNVKISGSLLSEADVLRIVKGVLAIYDADKTGLVDYALESAGGEIISTRCTENYRTRHAEISIFGIPIWYPSNTPRTVISPSIAPGECWAWTGFPGFLVIKLHSQVEVTGFSIEHIPQSLAPNGNIDSAPNNFTVWVSSQFF
jgi:SUN domain-containing protein 1/2